MYIAVFETSLECPKVVNNALQLAVIVVNSKDFATLTTIHSNNFIFYEFFILCKYYYSVTTINIMYIL